MAWPSRLSWSSLSRRERNSALYAVVASGFAVVVGLGLLIGGRADPARGAGLRSAAADVTAPLWSWTNGPAKFINQWSDSIDDYFATIDHNRHLEARLTRMRALVQERDALQRQNRQLKALLAVVDVRAGWSRVVAIAAASSGSYIRSAVVAGGQKHGLRPGQPVRNADGLVGRVTDVGVNASRVLLIIDGMSRIPVRVVRTGKTAMVAGINDGLVEILYTAPIDGPLRVGDRLVTSGDGGVFPPDLPVATIVGFSGETPMARPAARLDGLGYVIVQSPWFPPVVTPAPDRGSAR